MCLKANEVNKIANCSSGKYVYLRLKYIVPPMFCHSKTADKGFKAPNKISI